MNKSFNRIFIIENEKQDYDQFRSKYGLEIINELLKQQIVNVVDKGSNIVFNFVGVAICREYIFCVFPKYFNETKNSQDCMPFFSELINVIKKYGKETTSDMDILLEKVDSDFLSILPLIDFLLRDFYQNGYLLYFSESVSLDGEDEIHWQKTTDENYAFIMNGVPHYLELYRLKRNTEINTLVNKIHKGVIYECVKKFADILGYQFDFMTLDDSISLMDLGDKNLIIHILKSRLSLSYNDREILVLKSLIKFIEDCFEISDQVFIYGTKEFEYVWEDVCKKIFKHKNPAIMPNNLWKSYEYRFLKQELKQTLKPDVILEEENVYWKDTLILADAKYYDIKFDPQNKTIINKPGIGDILKQFTYEKALKQSKVHINKIYNILLFPTINSKFVNVIGEVSIEFPKMVNGRGSKFFLEYRAIQLVMLSTDVMFKKYLNDETLGIKEIDRLIDILIAYKKRSNRIRYD